MHNHPIKVYITIVFCVIYTPTSFDTFRVTIRELQPVTHILQIAVVDNTIIKLSCLAQAYTNSQSAFFEITFLVIVKMLHHCPFYNKTE